MTNKTITDLEKDKFPDLLKEINDPPKKLRIQGRFPNTKNMKYLTVVGSRKYSSYGKSVCESLISGLASYNICIVSGLALGIDSIAHNCALNSNLKTIAVPGSGLSDRVLYPKTHINLRDKILDSGGCILSEFEDDFQATPYSFPQRNRIMAGMCDAVLVIEAEIKSGTLITSKFATEYNRDVLTVPQNIFSKTSEGPSMLLKLGATPITKSEDILTALKIDIKEDNLFSEKNKNFEGLSEEEVEILKILAEPKSKEEIMEITKKPAHKTQTIISILEIKGLIKEEMGVVRIVI